MRKVVVLVGLLLALAGCGVEPTKDSLDDLWDALNEEGYLAHGVSYTGADHVVGVDAILDYDKPAVIDAGPERAAERIAEIVWTTFPGEVSGVEVEINLSADFYLRAKELTEMFGERPDGLGERDGTMTVVLIVAGVFLAGLVVLVVLVCRTRPRRAEEPN